MPILKVGGVAKLSQSKAIERFLARKLALAGAGEIEAAHVDAVGEVLVDVRIKIQGGAGKDAAAQDAAVTGVVRSLGDLDKFAAAAGSDGHLVGAGLTLADIQLYACKHYLLATCELKERMLAEFAKHAKLEAVVAAVAAVPGIAAWEAGRTARAEAF